MISIINSYKNSHNNVFLFGYFGSIVNDINHKPSKEMIKYLKSLAEDERNTIFIVSDFPAEKMDISLNLIKGAILIASSGLKIKKVGYHSDFVKTHTSGVVWKPAILSVME